MFTQEIRDALSQFSESYNPSSLNAPGLEAVPDGEYDFLIESAAIKLTEVKKKLIVEFNLRVEALDLDVQHANFLSTQKNADILGADLCRLGFSEQLGHGKNFVSGVESVLPLLQGVRFHAEKVTKDGFANLYIKSKLAGGATLPASAPAYSTLGANEMSIPF